MLATSSPISSPWVVLFCASLACGASTDDGTQRDSERVAEAPRRAFADVDGDGLVDLYVVAARGADRMYRNRGDGGFEDVTERAGLGARGGTRDALWKDFDGDGRIDLALVTRDGELALFRNEGAWRFREVSQELGLVECAPVGAAEWMDYDGDGRLDLAVEASGRGPLFFHALPSGGFERVELAGADEAADTPELRSAIAGAAPVARGPDPSRTGEYAGASSASAPASPGPSPLSPASSGRGTSRAGATPPSSEAAVVPGGLGAADPAPDKVRNAAACLFDAVAQSCVEVSTVPQLGALYPLGPEFSIDPNGDVSIGSSDSPAASFGPGPSNRRLYVRIADVNAVAVFGESTAPSGVTEGVRGESSSTSGRGVVGRAAALTGDTVGLRGESLSPAGRGVSGEAPSEGVRGAATAGTGIARGVCGTSASDTGEGVLGEASDASGDNVGVRGTSASPNGRGVSGEAPSEGVRGMATAGSGVARGVCGTSASSEGEGVLGAATARSGANVGVRGTSASPEGSGVEGVGPGFGLRGIATRSTGTAVGVYGTSDGTDGVGVKGAGFLGVHGASDVAGGIGVLGQALRTTGNDAGVEGHSASDDREAAGVRAEGNGIDSSGTGPAAAALEVRNGAVVFSGAVRAAGTIGVSSAAWEDLRSCSPGAHVFGHYVDVQLLNDLVVDDSIVLLTVYAQTGATDPNAYFAEVYEVGQGYAKIRVSTVGNSGGTCSEPAQTLVLKVNYLVLNPGLP